MNEQYYPRLDSKGIYLSKYYYNENPFHLSEYGLPNCTCYAWGRFYEICGIYPERLQMGDAGEWFPKAERAGDYKTGNTPALGAIICWASTVGGAGHVAVVEQINEDGSFIISQSGYYRPVADYPPDTEDYFWTDTCNATTKLAPWMDGRYSFQGFIYNRNQPIPPDFGKIPIWLLFKFKKGV